MIVVQALMNWVTNRTLEILPRPLDHSRIMVVQFQRVNFLLVLLQFLLAVLYSALPQTLVVSHAMVTTVSVLTSTFLAMRHLVHRLAVMLPPQTPELKMFQHCLWLLLSPPVSFSLAIPSLKNFRNRAAPVITGAVCGGMNICKTYCLCLFCVLHY